MSFFLDGSQGVIRRRTLFLPVTELFADIQDKLPLATVGVPLSHPSWYSPHVRILCSILCLVTARLPCQRLLNEGMLCNHHVARAR
jgi:hypothetical protein